MPDSYSQLRAHREQIRRQTVDQFQPYIETIETAISLMIDATEVLQRTEGRVDHQTAEGAAKFAVWRFLSALPSTASLSYEAAVGGDYFEAKTMLRLVLEESAKLIYYSNHPEDALRQVVRSRDKDDIDLSDVVSAVASDRGAGLMRLHGHLSAYYSHANLNIPDELLYLEDENRPQLGGGPRFEPQLFEPIAQQLLILAANALYATSIHFPALSNDSDWSERFAALTEQASSLMPDRDTYGSGAPES